MSMKRELTPVLSSEDDERFRDRTPSPQSHSKKKSRFTEQPEIASSSSDSNSNSESEEEDSDDNSSSEGHSSSESEGSGDSDSSSSRSSGSSSSVDSDCESDSDEPLKSKEKDKPNDFSKQGEADIIEVWKDDPKPIRPLDDALRNKFIDTLKQSLSVSPPNCTDDHSLECAACYIEHALYFIPGTLNPVSRQQYQTKLKTFIFNLRRNPTFRSIFLRREMTPQQVAALTSDDLANAEEKEWRERLYQERLRELRPATNSLEVDSDQHTCDRCGGMQTTSTQFLSFASKWGEGETGVGAIIQCKKCGNRWRM